jgi:hypothetical protein
VITGLQRRHAGTDLYHYAGAFMPQDRWKQALAVETVQRIGVGVADAGRLDLDQDLAGARTFQVNLNDFEGLLGFECDGGAGLHGISLLKTRQA